MAVNKIFASWTWNRKLPAPFDDVSVNVKSSMHLSTYNTESTRTASLHAATLSAILQRMELPLPQRMKMPEQSERREICYIRWSIRARQANCIQ